MKSERHMLAGAIGSLAVRVTSAVLMFLMSVVIARSTSIETFGWYNFIVVTATFCALLLQFGADKSVIRFLPVYLQQGNILLARAFVGWVNRNIALFAPIVSGIAAVVFIRSIEPALDVLSLLIAVSLVPAIAFLQFWQQVERSYDYIIRSQILEQVLVPAGVTLIILACYCLFGSLPLESVVAVHLSFIVCSATYLSIRLRRRGRNDVVDERLVEAHLPVAPGKSNEWKKVSLPLAAAGLMSFFLIRGEIVLLAIFLGPEDVAIYSIALRIANLLIFGLSAATAVAGPRFSSAYFGDDQSGLQSILSRAATFSLLFGLPAAVLLLIAPEMILGVFGTEYMQGKWILMFLVLVNLLNIAVGPVAVLLSVTDQHKFYLSCISAVAAAKFVLLVPAAHFGGIWGVVVVSGGATVCWTVWLAIGVRQRLGVLAVPFFRLSRQH